MNTNATNHSALDRQQKKAQFSNPSPSGRKKNLLTVGALVMIGALSYFYSRGFTGEAESTAVTVSTATSSGGAEENGEVSIPVSDFGLGQAKYFKYVAADKKAMRFFVVRSSDGVFRAALDACDVCYRHKKGYQHVGDEMVCRKCGQRFPSKLVNEVTGGCNPVALARRTAGSNLLVKAADLENLRSYFE